MRSDTLSQEAHKLAEVFQHNVMKCHSATANYLRELYPRGAVRAQ